MKRIPTLDGWRGIAILLVLLDHLQVSIWGDHLRPWTNVGQHGVTVFFVLSGFLITSKLLEGPIDLRRFYVRRLFRLMPAAWAYLAALSIADLWSRHKYTSPAEITSCLLFYRNFRLPQFSTTTAHFWSLSVEEQFYLLWPLLLLLLGARRCRIVAIAGILLCAWWRLAHWSYYDRLWYSFRTEARADALFVGCLLAIVMSTPDGLRSVQRWARYWILPALAGTVWCSLRFHWLPPLFECVCLAALIAAGVVHANRGYFRWLESRPLALLGTVSYSLYVWQQYFLIPRSRSHTLMMIALMPIIALASYYGIEKPLIRLGHRLTNASAQRDRRAEQVTAGV